MHVCRTSPEGSVCRLVCLCVCFVIVCLWVGPSLIQRGCLEVMDVWPWLNGARCFGFVALSRLCCCIMNHSFAGRQEEPCGFWLSTLRLTCCSHFHTLGFFFFFSSCLITEPSTCFAAGNAFRVSSVFVPLFFFFNNSLPDLAAASREVEKHVVARTRLCVHCRRVRRMEWGKVFLLSPSGSRHEGRLSNYVPPVSFCVMHIHVAFKVCVCVLWTIQVISGIINILRQVVDNESNVALCY